MYIILHEYPYEFSEVVGVYDSLDKLNQALEEQDIEKVRDPLYPDYSYTKTIQYDDYTSTDYYTIIEAPINTFNKHGYIDTEG